MKKCIVTLIFTAVLLSLNFNNRNNVLYAPELSTNINYLEDFEQFKKEYKVERYGHLMSVDFSKENLKALYEFLELPDPEIIYVQSLIETGHHTSPLFKNHNNLHGMHFPNKRQTVAKGYVIADKGRRVSKYHSWQESVIDFGLYVKYWESKGYDSSDWKKFLVDVRYCELGGKYLELIDKFQT